MSGTSTEGANHTSPGQRPGYPVKKAKALKGRPTVGMPFQGFVLIAWLSQGVALGWYVAGPSALSADAAVTVHDRL